MKQILILFLLLVAQIQLFAQSYTLSKDTSVANYNLSDIYINGVYAPVQIPVYLTNHSSSALTTTWVRKNYSIPAGWTNSICDTGGCYATGVSTNSFRLGPDSTTELMVDFFPTSAGNAVTLLHIYNGSDTSDQVNPLFLASITGTLGITSVNAVKDIYLSPVPAKDKLSVIYNKGLQPSRMELYNVLGQLILTENISHTNSFETAINVSGLQNGMYFLKVYGADNKIITRQFSKD